MTVGRRPPLIWIVIFWLVAIGVVTLCVLLAAGTVAAGSLALTRRAASPEAPVAPVAVLPSALPLEYSTPGTGELSQPRGLPGVAADIPIPPGVEQRAFVGLPQNFSFLSDLSYADMLAFYQQQLPAMGWEAVEGKAQIGASGAALFYVKGERRLTVHIADAPVVGTVVEVIEQI